VTKAELVEKGKSHILYWCEINSVTPPEIYIRWCDPLPDSCAFYHNKKIFIWPNSCSSVSSHPRQWSHPGYVVDRTPYGVLAHELGHHVDVYAAAWRIKTGEAKITNYCPNDDEWFAEIFRLFVTNPHLLHLLRPKVFQLMVTRWPKLAETRPWEIVLAGADRWISAAQNKIAKIRS